MFKKSLLSKILFLLLIILMISDNSMAQCAMCRATVSSNLSEGRGVIGTGLNFGILYLLLTPYVLVGGLFLVWYKVARRN